MSTLPKISANMEWVISTTDDKTTVTLSYAKSLVEEAYESSRVPRDAGFIMHHTFKHPPEIERDEWEMNVRDAAEAVWYRYQSSNEHAKWADEIMRRSR